MTQRIIAQRIAAMLNRNIFKSNVMEEEDETTTWKVIVQQGRWRPAVKRKLPNMATLFWQVGGGRPASRFGR